MKTTQYTPGPWEAKDNKPMQTYNTMTKKYLFRIWQDGNLFWEGRAYDMEHAEEKCFSDDSPGSLERFTMHRGNVCKKTGITRWACVYENQCLASY